MEIEHRTVRRLDDHVGHATRLRLDCYIEGAIRRIAGIERPEVFTLHIGRAATIVTENYELIVDAGLKSVFTTCCSPRTIE